MTGTLDLGVIGNSHIAALIDREARIVWHCAGKLDGDPVFCRLLNPVLGDEGFCDLQLRGYTHSEQYYQRNTAVLITILHAEDGSALRVTDFVPRFKQHGRIFRPAYLVRRIEPLHGLPNLRIRMRPLVSYGAERPHPQIGSDHIRFQSHSTNLRLTTDAPVSYVANEMEFPLQGPVTLIIGPDESVDVPLDQGMRDYLERTLEYWEEWVRYLSVPFEWQDAVIRAAITLKLCSFEDTGAIVAALTTSIPEAPGTERNWDYRFCWLRDSYFVVHALNTLGATRTMEDFLRYITSIASLHTGDELQPLYGIVPDSGLEEKLVTSLQGYRNMGPVRLGNAAYGQRQNDSYGSIVLAAAQMYVDKRLPRGGDEALFQLLESVAQTAVKVGLTPDASLWEYRGRNRIHTHSAAMCWAACRRLSSIAAILGKTDRATYWAEQALHLREAIEKHAWNPARNSFVASFDGNDMDASLLLLQEIGFLSASDPRFLGTVEAVGRELRRGNHLQRYAVEDDFGLPKTAFNISTFWYIDALAATGRREEAREIFEAVLSARNHLGLLSEDTDPQDNSLWGNFPQTYSMVGVIICATRLSKTWEEAFWRAS